MFKEEKYYNHHGEKVMQRTVKLADRFNDEKGFMFYYNGHTVNGLVNIGFPEAMTIRDVAYLAHLSRKLIPYTNFIGYRGNGGTVKPMTPKQIGDVVGIGERQAYRFIRKMIELEMMAKVTFETGTGARDAYLINPLYYMNGRNINDLLYWAFQDQLDKYIPEWAKNRYKERREGELTDGNT